VPQEGEEMPENDHRHMKDTGAGRFATIPGSAYRELLQPDLVAISMIVAGMVALILTTMEMADDTLSGFLLRAAYYGLTAALTWPVGHGLATMLLYLTRCRHPSLTALAALAAGLYEATTSAMVGSVLVHQVLPDSTAANSWSELWVRAAVQSLAHIGLITYFAVERARRRLPADAPDTSIENYHNGSRRRVLAATESTEVLATWARRWAGAQFLERLPKRLGRDVVYLKGNGHYVDVVTTAGSGTLLLRFSEAIAELGEAGMQVHRSYWVAFRHMAGLGRRDGRTVLRLMQGEVIPVGRTFLAIVREAIPDDPTQPGG
jgi:DNA-binding LytR/AlgR family response regulator